MEYFHHLTDPQSRVSRNIRIRAARLARTGNIPGVDVDDIAQDLRMDLLQRSSKFDPKRASFATFADRVLSNRISALASETQAMRVARRTLSFDAPASNDADDGLTLAEVIPVSASQPDAGEFSLIHGIDLQMDVVKLLAALDPGLRRIAIAISHAPVAQVAHALGLHRSTVYANLDRIRETALSLGLSDYFPTETRQIGPPAGM